MAIKTIAAFLALVPALCLGQFIGGEDNKPWEDFKLNPKTRVSLNFKNANVDAVIGMLSKTSGVTIVKDPALTGAITVTSAKPVSLNDAFQILATTLSLKNYDMRKEGNLLVIKARQQQNRNQGGMGGMSPEVLSQMFSGGGGQSQLKVYYIQYANASQVSRVINDVFASSGMPQFNPAMMGAFGGGNQGGGNQNNRRQQMQNFGRMFGQQQSNVRASSDDFSNSVIVNAPSTMQEQVSDLIRKLDKQTDQPQAARVYKLQFADADELAPTVQNVLTANAPKGRGGVSAQNVPIEQRFQQAMRFGSASAAFGTVVADDRTNSLIITATAENQELVAKVIEELDTEVKTENTTFVFPLNNARADQMASLLQQAFGTRQGASGNINRNTGANNNRNNTNNRNRNNNLGGGNNRLGGGGLQTYEADPENKYLQVPVEDDDTLATAVAVQQGGGFGQFFGGGGQRRTTQAGGGTQTARDANGRLINVRDLQNQITIIPDPNTNSLIVVTTPENVQMLQSILDQLDRIPEQVMIETMIIEATLDSSSQFGVEWKYAQNKAFGNPAATGNAESNFGGQTANPALQGFRYTLTGGDLGVFINALKTDRKFQVLSTPKIFTSNNQEAEINISQRVPYVLSSREDANGNLSFQYSFLDVGIILTVTPHIGSNGVVTMDVTQTANDLQGYTDFNAPIINQRQADTTVSVNDGETIILGGIIRNNVTSTVRKIPLLGDIPILGNLFRSTSKGNVKTELMVFLTPRIVRNPDEARKLREEQSKQLSPQSQKNIQKQLPPPSGTTDPKNGAGDPTKGKGGGK